MKFRGLIFLLVLLSLHPVMAQEADSLQASLLVAPRGGTVAPSDTIGRERLSRTLNIAEAVRSFAGVQIRDFGGVGGLKTVNVRSMGSEHTGVYMDGIRIENAQNMQVDLGRYSTDNLERVEVFSSLKASLLQTASEYGTTSSLHLTTARPQFLKGERNHVSVRLRGGSFLTLSPALSWEHLIGRKTSLRLSTAFTTSRGRYRFRDRDTVMIRENCDVRSVRAEGQLFGGTADAGWTVKGYFYDSERGIPGPVFKRAGVYPLSIDRQMDRNAFLQGEWHGQYGNHRVKVRGKATYDRLDYSDYSEEDYSLPSAYFRYRLLNVFASLSWNMQPVTWCNVGAAGDFSYSYLDANLRDFVYPSRFCGYFAGSVTMTPGRFKAVASLLYSVRADHFGVSDFQVMRHFFAPSLLLGYMPFKDFDISLYVKRSDRVPTFNDLYYTNVGNKDLRPEVVCQGGGSVNYGLSRNKFRMRLGVEAYYNHLKDKILAVPSTSLFRWQMYNIGKVSVIGTDVKANLRYGETSHAGLTLRYTFQRALNLSDRTGATWRQQVPYIPLHSGSALLYGTWKGWKADLTASFCGARYTTSVNLPEYRLDPWMTLDLILGKELKVPSPMPGGRGGTLAMLLSLYNLTASRYQIVQGYPMPGFNAMASVIFQW